jgi:hypothetical protein
MRLPCAEAYVPLTNPYSFAFTESGSYFTSFTITVDALSQIVAGANNNFLADYEDGVTEIDASRIPPAPTAPPVIPHCLTIIGLPQTAHSADFLDVFIMNSEGNVAKCVDYTAIRIMPFEGKSAAVIPLVYDNNRNFNGLDFSESGSFIVTFSFFSDALNSIVVTRDNFCIVDFSDGTGLLDVSDIPLVPHKYLTITGLPQNTQQLNIADVFVWNQTGKIAKCEDYSLLAFEYPGNSTTLKIPLIYSSANQLFDETGPFYVSFDLNVDALTRFFITETDKVLVNFVNGNGTLDAANLPVTLPVSYLTIVGLPLHTSKNNFSDVFVYNNSSKIAKVADYADITISKNASSASAMIPLVYNDNSKEYFHDSGSFFVSFTINVDAYIQIIKTRDDAFTVDFSDGSVVVNLSADCGYFSGGLVNPTDTSPPVNRVGGRPLFERPSSHTTVRTVRYTAVQ